VNVKVGGAAPHATLDAWVKGEPEPQRVALSDYRGSWVVLFFYPRDFTFVCPTELAAFAELNADFAEVGAVVLAASTDSYWSHRAWFGSTPLLAGVDYPVLADTTQELAAAFGVLQDDGAAQRGTFVIDPEGVIRHATVSDLKVGRSADETLRIVYALQTGGLCPAGWRPGDRLLEAA
jgi:peroxiredoxin (alkyl hydroperoxide reductase subunit C)